MARQQQSPGWVRRGAVRGTVPISPLHTAAASVPATRRVIALVDTCDPGGVEDVRASGQRTWADAAYCGLVSHGMVAAPVPWTQDAGTPSATMW